MPLADNIPFFTRQATLGDTIEVLCTDGECFYAATREASTNSLVRVVLFDGHPAALVRSELLRLGCDSELSHLNSLISVNVPATVDIAVIRHFLDAGCTNGLWDYEEPILRQ